jgi:recyclin-1
MDKFATLEPTRLYASAATTGARFFSSNSAQKASLKPEFIGRLPADLHLLILIHLPVPDIPAYSLCSRRTASLSRDERVWESKWKHLGVEKHSLSPVLDDLEARALRHAAVSRAAAPPTIPVDHIDDDFGDFTSVNAFSPKPEELGDFVGAFKTAGTSLPPVVSKPTFRAMYIRAHGLLKSILPALLTPSHLILSALSRLISPSLRHQAKTLHLLALFLSSDVQPVRRWQSMYSSLRSAMDRFDATLLAAFDLADSKGDEDNMREATESSWEIWDGIGDWEMGKVWADKRELFYEQGQWEPLDNFRYMPCWFSRPDLFAHSS